MGILKGQKISHVAPKVAKASELMGNLFEYLKKDKEHNIIIKSCIARYEIEFIHPFSDGNGRISRFWQ